MLDSKYKEQMNKIWELAAIIFVKLKFTPNMITVLGLVLVTASCIYYALTANALIFGIILFFSMITDGMDGAVARIKGMSSKTGAYLDATTDRYQEGIIFLSIGYVTHLWLWSYIAMMGSFLISYNKTRALDEADISKEQWPDLMERLERAIFIICGLILEGLFPNKSVILYVLIIFSFLVHFTALQRFVRAVKLIKNSTGE